MKKKAVSILMALTVTATGIGGFAPAIAHAETAVELKTASTEDGTSIETAIPLSDGETKDVMISSVFDYQYFKITPEETGYYKFISINTKYDGEDGESPDANALIVDSDELNMDDPYDSIWYAYGDDDDGDNFNITAYMEGGHTYYLIAGLVAHEGPYEIHMEKTESYGGEDGTTISPFAGSEVYSYPEVGDSITLDLFVENPGEYTYRWTDEDGNVIGDDSMLDIVVGPVSYARYECEITAKDGYTETVVFILEPDNGIRLAEEQEENTTVYTDKNGTATLSVKFDNPHDMPITCEWYKLDGDEREYIESGTSITVTPKSELEKYVCYIENLDNMDVNLYYDVIMSDQDDSGEASDPSGDNTGDESGNQNGNGSTDNQAENESSDNQKDNGSDDKSGTVDEAKTVSIASAKVSRLKAKAYTGKAVTQGFTVTVSGKKLTKGTDYKVSYKNNKKVGKATVIIEGIGDYTGKITKTFNINPKATKVSKVTAGKKAVKVTWKKQTKETTGYEIQYSTKKNFKSGTKTVTVNKTKTASKKINKLKSGKKYYVRVRTFKNVSGKKFYSSWSNVKSVTIK